MEFREEPKILSVFRPAGSNGWNAMTDASQLLRAYVAESSEEAFRSLVEHHISLVYSTALRFAGTPRWPRMSRRLFLRPCSEGAGIASQGGAFRMAVSAHDFCCVKAASERITPQESREGGCHHECA